MKPKGPFLNIRFHGGKRTCILKNIFFSPSFSVVPPEEENNLLQKKIFQMLSKHAHFPPLRTSSSVSGISEALLYFYRSLLVSYYVLG